MPLLPVRLVVAVVSCLFVAPAPPPAAATVCPARGDVVVVDARRLQLSLCAACAAVETFSVALGTGGLGKQRTGDNRTPLGAYPLGTPRPSAQFGTFIPVGYPTAGQLKAGFTGSAVGIHGPLRAYAWAGAANTLHDWTAGCIAVGSDAEMGRLAAWVRTHRPVNVQIVAPPPREGT